MPLYRAIFEKYKGGQLPPVAAFEREIALLGVSEKQKGRARQVFERSAEQGGFFDQGKNRLVKPGVAEASSSPTLDNTKLGGGGNDGNDPPSDRHKLVEALVDVLPKTGQPFEIDDLADWLQAAEINLRIIYKIKGRITIQVDPKKQA